MYNRIRICLCHPSKIATFFRDKALSIALYVLGLFVVFLATSALRAYTTDYFNYSDTKSITNIVLEKNSGDAVYDASTYKLTGTPLKYEASDFVLDVLLSEGYANVDKLVFKMKEESVDVVFMGYLVSNYTYEELKPSGFTFEGILQADPVDIINFQSLMNTLLDKVNITYANYEFIQSIYIAVSYFAVILIVGCISSYFINPKIDWKTRVKLCLYSSGVFFLVMTFAVLLNYVWLQYLAMILPLIYTNITFSHIIKISKPIR